MAGKGAKKGVYQGQGRKPGVQNKLTIDMKERINRVFVALQEKDDVSLQSQAEEDPKWFYQNIWVKMLPKELEHAGKDGLPLVIIKDYGKHS